MPDVYANITSAATAVVEQIADVLELRATDPQQRVMREAYLSDVAFPPNARVLDIGCGTGALTRVLAKWPKVSTVVGLDPSPILLDRARQLAMTDSRLTFEEGDARALPFEASSFDLTLFHTTLCHVPEPERALGEAFRVLRPGGWLAVFDGDYATTSVAIGDFDPLQACVDAWVGSSVHDRWLLRRLPAMARSIGFEVASVRSHGYVQNTNPEYMMTIVSRGIDTLIGSRRIGRDVGDSLRAEARRRADAGEFFGHIGYVSVVGRKPSRSVGIQLCGAPSTVVTESDSWSACAPTQAHSVVTMCAELGIAVIAEGVETAAERDTLLALGCDLLQGYFFGKPGAAGAAATL